MLLHQKDASPLIVQAVNAEQAGTRVIPEKPDVRLQARRGNAREEHGASCSGRGAVQVSLVCMYILIVLPLIHYYLQIDDGGWLKLAFLGIIVACCM
jgi:hypothetical protein